MGWVLDLGRGIAHVISMPAGRCDQTEESTMRRKFAKLLFAARAHSAR
jgi:hypothetical protein